MLRVCNAFPHELPLQVFYDGLRLTEQSLPYKDCGTWRNVGLTVGKELHFKVGDESAGTLVIADLPWSNAVVAVVVFDLKNAAGSFESRVFEDIDAAQVAVFDAYRGPAEASLSIQDPADHDLNRKEELHYDSAVILRPGRYDVVLKDQQGEEEARAAFGVVDGESYIVVRCGGERAAGSSPQEVFVYPVSDAARVEASSSEGSGGWGTSDSSEASTTASTTSKPESSSDKSTSSSSDSATASSIDIDTSKLEFSSFDMSLGGAKGLAGLAAVTLVFAIVVMTCLSSQ